MAALDAGLQERRVQLPGSTGLLSAETQEVSRSRIGRGRCPPRPPTDPDVQISLRFGRSNERPLVRWEDRVPDQSGTLIAITNGCPLPGEPGV